MQKIQYFCDVCDKECLPKDGLGTFTGFIVKVNTEFKPEQIGFSGHYCSECSEKMLNFVSELKQNAKD